MIPVSFSAKSWDAMWNINENKMQLFDDFFSYNQLGTVDSQDIKKVIVCL